MNDFQLSREDLDGLPADEEFNELLGAVLAEDQVPDIMWDGELRPEILCHPNIPKPLHGVNPRTIMGKSWWDKTRQEVYESTRYHCIACGVHKRFAKGPKWLEAHEFWEISHKTGICKISSIEPLCHYCHNFIHSGRLGALWAKREISDERVVDILNHGFEVLSKAGLQCFGGTLDLAEILELNGLEVNTREVTPYPEEYGALWGDYVLIWEGKEYRGFDSFEDWDQHYNAGDR